MDRPSLADLCAMRTLVLVPLLIRIALPFCEAQHSSFPTPPISPPMQPTSNPYYSLTDTAHLNVSDAEWKKALPDSVYHVAREQGTEYAFTGKYWNFEGIGLYRCVCCGNALFRSDGKFASSCGWPSFFEPVRPNAVIYLEDRSHGMQRTEVRCGRCDGHLGHLFNDGPPPTHKRFCMNSLVLQFEPGK